MDIERIFLARNELENQMNDLRESLELTESEMMIVLEMVLSTARHQSMVRGIYNKVKIVKKENNDGNTNEKGQ